MYFQFSIFKLCISFLRMEAVCYSKALVSIYQTVWCNNLETIWCNNPEDHSMKYFLNHDMCKYFWAPCGRNWWLWIRLVKANIFIGLHFCQSTFLSPICRLAWQIITEEAMYLIATFRHSVFKSFSMHLFLASFLKEEKKGMLMSS
jgi:hypothetical protein